MISASLSELIDSAIGSLGVKLIQLQEHRAIQDEGGEISKRLSHLQSMINGASKEARSNPQLIESLKKILKSSEVTASPRFVSFLARRYPAIMMEVVKDPVIEGRINHLYVFMELNRCFSERSIARLRGGVDSIRKQVMSLSKRIEDEDDLFGCEVFNDEVEHG